jgi:hypothetical protein
MNVTVTGNFGVTSANINPVFQQTGWWYDYLSGDSIYVSNVTTPLNHQPGEYHVYTSRRLTTPDLTIGLDEITDEKTIELSVYPNPATSNLTLHYRLENASGITLEINNLNGEKVYEKVIGRQQPGEYTYPLDLKREALPGGIYLVRLTSAEGTVTRRIVVH